MAGTCPALERCTALGNLLAIRDGSKAMPDLGAGRQEHDRYDDLLESIQAGDFDGARDQLAEVYPLQACLPLEDFDRRQMNRCLKLYA
jgi:hypothetical protein